MADKSKNVTGRRIRQQLFRRVVVDKLEQEIDHPDVLPHDIDRDSPSRLYLGDGPVIVGGSATGLGRVVEKARVVPETPMSWAAFERVAGLAPSD